MFSTTEISVQLNEALDKIRPALLQHGGNARIVEIGEDFVRFELEGSCSGCPMSIITFGTILEEAIRKKLPQIKNVFYD